MRLPGPLPKTLPWFYATRGLGVVLLLYGLLVDQTPERGTIILGGLGLLGVEKVAKSDESKKSKVDEANKPKRE